MLCESFAAEASITWASVLEPALLQQHRQPRGVGNWLLQLPGDPEAVQPMPIPGKTASCVYLVPRPAVHTFRWAWTWEPMSLCLLLRAAEIVHTPHASGTKEELQAGQEPEALDVGWCCVRWPCREVWLFTSCTHFLQQFSFSLISCVFLRNLAKSVIIPLCFILRSKGGNHLHLLFGGRKFLQPLLWSTPPVFLSSSTYCQCVTGRWVCGVFPSNHRKMRSKSLRRGINSRTSHFLRTRAVQSSLGFDEHCWKDEWSVLTIFQWQDSYSLLLYVAPAVDDSLSKATNIKITFCSLCTISWEMTDLEW